jgi:hypothetical protein
MFSGTFAQWLRARKRSLSHSRRPKRRLLRTLRFLTRRCVSHDTGAFAADGGGVVWCSASEVGPFGVREASGLRPMCTHFAPADGCGAKCDRFIPALSANRRPECTNFAAIGSCSAKCGQAPPAPPPAPPSPPTPPPPSRGRQDPGMTGKAERPQPGSNARSAGSVDTDCL